ncbi:MAG: hypothetical protein JW709_10215 [Sedimentisphaerales bacterium]|nr:hypothetical protein [Sedimentisphaerales bacterium]
MTADSGICTIKRACILGIVLLTSLSITGLHAESIYRIGILLNHNNTPPFVASLDQPSVHLTVLTYKDLTADGSQLGQFNCLLIPNSPSFPQVAFADLKRFIENGNDLILLGGQSFSHPLWLFQDQWLTRDQLRRQMQLTLADSQLIIKPDSPMIDWERHAQNLKTPSRIIYEDQHFDLEIRDIDLWAWDTYAHPFPDDIPSDHNTLTFELKASLQTKRVVIEIIENDKSRWMYVAPATTDWEKHIVRKEDFTFFSDGSPPDRGYAGDKLNLPNAKTISIGLAFNISPFTPGNHDISIRQIATAKTTLPAGFTKTADSLPLPIFEDRDIYRLKKITTISTYHDQDLLANIPDISGDFVGMSAVGFAYPEASRYIPLLDACDCYGRTQGLAAGLLVHYEGPYAPGQWFISGIETPAFYQSQTFTRTLNQVVEYLKTRKLLARYQELDKCNQSSLPEPPDNSDLKNKEKPLRISRDGRHFITADNRRFFVIGCNYLGPRDRKCQIGGPLFDAVKIEADFRAAKDAGINLFRFWSANIETEPDHFHTILELAQKYNIYLLLLPAPHVQPTDEQTLDALEATARLAGGCPMVVGYDLLNEPLLTDVGATRINHQPSPILRHRSYERYPSDLTNRRWVDQLTQNRSGWPTIKSWVNDDDARELLAAHFLCERLVQEQMTCSNLSLLCGLEGKLELPDAYHDLQQAVNQTFQRWIDFQIKALKNIAPDQFVTVGYNSPLAALAANQSLDFQAYHLYNFPFSRRDLDDALSTLDRLQSMFPRQPITLGEFGYSSGLKLPDGEFLDIHSAGVAEIMTLLYAYVHDYGGAMFWLLNEWPIANIRYNAPWIPPEKYLSESRLGLYYHDGTEQGHKKPIAYATAFFSRFLDTQPSGSYTFTLTDASIPIQTGYIFQGPNALFVGDQEYHSSEISFKAPHPVNVMIRWDRKSIHLMATTDTSVTFNPVLITKQAYKQPLTVSGKCSELSQNDNEISIGLLAGETVSLLLDETQKELQK